MSYNTNLSLIRVEFVVACTSNEERMSILNDLDNFTTFEHPAYPQFASFSEYDDPSVKTTDVKFSVLYNEDDSDSFDQFFFKMKLKYPEFREILTEKAFSMRS